MTTNNVMKRGLMIAVACWLLGVGLCGSAWAQEEPFRFRVSQVRSELAASYASQEDNGEFKLGSYSHTRISLFTLLAASPTQKVLRISDFDITNVKTASHGAMTPRPSTFHTQDVHHWSVSDHTEAADKPVTCSASLPLIWLREPVDIHMRGQVMYASGQPEEITLSPITDYLGHTIHVENIPGLTLRVTRKPTAHSTNMEYSIWVKDSHRHHVYRVRFLDGQRRAIAHAGGSSIPVNRSVEPRDGLDKRILQVPTEQACHAVVFEVFPQLHQKEVDVVFEGLEMMPRQDTGKPLMLEPQPSEAAGQ